MIEANDITGVILCGGDARRMYGVDKPLQLLGGLPLVSHVRARLAPQVGRVVISANRSLREYSAWGDPVVHDTIADRGPLGGVLAVVTSDHVASTPYVFVCPGDAPALDHALVARLAGALDEVPGDAADVAVPHDGVREQHLFLLMRTDQHAAIDDYLTNGGRSVGGWLTTRRVLSVDASDIADSFANINTTRELRDAERRTLA